MADDDLDLEMPDDDAVLDAEDDEDTTDPAGEPEEAEGDEPDDEPERAARAERPSRTNGRVQRLAEEKRRLSDETDRLRRELEETRRRVPVQQEDPRVEAEREALMSPEDRVQYRVDKALRTHEQRQQQLMFQMQQQQDKLAFDTKANSDPLYKKLSDEVEREYQAVIGRGQYASRESILTYLVGKRAIEQRGKSKPKTEASRRRQEAPPVRGRGDARRGPGRYPDTPEGRAAAFEAKWGDTQI